MMWGIVIIVIGLLLLAAEVFIPSGGMLFILAMTALVLGVVMIFYAPESEGGGVTSGLIAVISLGIVLPVVLGIAFYYYPSTPMGKRLLLQQPTEEQSIADTGALLELEKYRGSYGKTLTPHQPSGATLIDGRRIDSIAEGMFVDSGQVVKVIGIQGSQLIIRPLQAPEMSGLPESLRDLPGDLLA
ncbi:MAG TPA: NfeD family protein [Gemmatales bacterium]|nr:NfeD family protein [Gemmatales bacterium]HMP58624.1 NfeD family protein [Gemmatales bacterium]